MKNNMDIYHFSDELSALSRDFAHCKQDTYPAEEVKMQLSDWLPLFLKFVEEHIQANADIGLKATSPEFKQFLKTVKPWDGPLPGGWGEIT